MINERKRPFSVLFFNDGVVGFRFSVRGTLPRVFPRLSSRRCRRIPIFVFTPKRAHKKGEREREREREKERGDFYSPFLSVVSWLRTWWVARSAVVIFEAPQPCVCVCVDKVCGCVCDCTASAWRTRRDRKKMGVYTDPSLVMKAIKPGICWPGRCVGATWITCHLVAIKSRLQQRGTTDRSEASVLITGRSLIRPSTASDGLPRPIKHGRQNGLESAAAGDGARGFKSEFRASQYWALDTGSDGEPRRKLMKDGGDAEVHHRCRFGWHCQSLVTSRLADNERRCGRPGYRKEGWLRHHPAPTARKQLVIFVEVCH